MVMWYWSVDTLFWQVLADHYMDVQCQRRTLQTKAAWLSISWSRAAMHGFLFLWMHVVPFSAKFWPLPTFGRFQLFNIFNGIFIK